MPNDLRPMDHTLPLPDGAATDAHAALPRPAPPGYEIERELGRGGMGVVYQARQTHLNRTVALKMILAGGHAGPAELARFLAEAEAVARLQHPGIVQLYEAGQHDGLPYFSLEFVGGGSLAESLRGTPLSPRGAAALVERLARAVQHAHERGIVHRDLKPANVLLMTGERGQSPVPLEGPAGRSPPDLDSGPKITDFGLAKWLASADGRTAEHLTQTGAVVGTPSYMAPEQAAGHSKDVGPAADVYALGAILYECLTGRPPFKGPTPLETLAQVLRREPVAPTRLQPDVPRDLDTICLKCLQKDPARRYASAGDLADDLCRYLGGEPVRARPVGGVERAVKWVRRRPAVAALLAVSAAALVALLAGGLWYQGQLESALEDVKGERDRVKQARAVAERERDTARAAETAAARERDAARTAEAETRRNLYHSLTREARALRLARTEGFREQAWDALGRAGKLDTPARDPEQLRREAVACLGDFVGLPAREIRGFPSSPVKLALHPDGSLIAVALLDKRIALHDSRDGRRVALLTGHASTCTVLAFRPDGSLLSADRGGNVQTWRRGESGHWSATRLATGVLARALTSDARYLAAAAPGGVEVRETVGGNLAGFSRDAIPQIVALSGDGRRLAALLGAPKGNEVAVWDVATGRLLHRTVTRFTRVVGLELNRDGTLLACTGSEGGLQLLDTDGLKQRWVLQSEAVIQARFSPDGQFLTLTTSSNRVVRYGVASGREVATVTHPDPKRTVDLVTSTDGRLLASAAEESVRIWDLDGTGERRVLAGHSSGVPNVVFSPDGKRLASSGKDGRVTLWDVATGKAVLTPARLPTTADCVAFSPDSRLLAVGGMARALRILDATTGETLLEPQHPIANVMCAAFSPDGEYFAASGHGLRLWRVHRTDRVADRVPQVALEPFLSRAGDYCSRICFSPDSRLLAWVHEHFTAKVLDMRTGADLPFRGRLLLGYHNLAFFPDSRRLGFISDQGAAEVWDVVAGTKSFALESGRILSYHVAVSPDGRRFAAQVSPQGIGVWDTSTRRLLFALPPERSPVWSLAWSPDNEKLAVGQSDGGVAVWDLRRMNELVRPLGLQWEE